MGVLCRSKKRVPSTSPASLGLACAECREKCLAALMPRRSLRSLVCPASCRYARHFSGGLYFHISRTYARRFSRSIRGTGTRTLCARAQTFGRFKGRAPHFFLCQIRRNCRLCWTAYGRRTTHRPP